MPSSTLHVCCGNSFRVLCWRLSGCCCFFFFFSSRRRHTRSDRDWSSDVCSSDLSTSTLAGPPFSIAPYYTSLATNSVAGYGTYAVLCPSGADLISLQSDSQELQVQIGRASCRERV